MIFSGQMVARELVVFVALAFQVQSSSLCVFELELVLVHFLLTGFCYLQCSPRVHVMNQY